MKFHVETERLIMRDFREEDAEGIFKLDSNPSVVQYLHMAPMNSLQQAIEQIEHVRSQYEKNGIGRWVLIEKATNSFVGWSGLKFENHPLLNNQQDYYDVGYRLLPEYWGRGYATESAIASVQYGWEKMGLKKMNAAAHSENLASKNVLKKIGFKEVSLVPFYDFQVVWYELLK
ncbi:MAG: GNAT family N-acetyltransferase [Bacteroidota bacterium]